jgi:hypothetical protein
MRCNHYVALKIIHMSRLEATRRCKLFGIIATKVWDQIVFSHRVDTEVSEIGVTNNIIAEIRNEQVLNPHFGVWANPGHNEQTHGSDIDVFVEANVNHFLWYPLQAKVLKVGGHYDRLRTRHQWTLLAELRNRVQCLPYYLFYSGINKAPDTQTDCCNHEIDEKHYGCMLVDIENVATIAGQRSEPRYIDFYPQHAHPWRELVCCKARRGDGRLFTVAEVRDGISIYQGVLNPDIIYRGSLGEEFAPNQAGAIRYTNADLGRTPSHSFVIRTTEGLNEPRQLFSPEPPQSNPIVKQW